MNYKLLENCYTISNNDEQYNWQINTFKLFGLPVPTLFKATGNCEQSHIDLVKMAKEKNLPYITIFEDDAMPCNDILQQLDIVENKLNTIWNNFSLLTLGYNWIGWYGENTEKTLYDYFLTNNNTTAGSQAIFIKREAYDERINSLINMSNKPKQFYKDTKYVYADRYCQQDFKNQILISKTNLFCQFNISKSIIYGYNSKQFNINFFNNYYSNITIEDMLNNSYVIYQNDNQYQYFKDIFFQNNLFPIPKKIKLFEISNDKQANYAFSHETIIKIAKQFNLPYVCIFEDTAYPSIDILKKIKHYLTNIPKKINILTFGNTYFEMKPYHINHKYHSVKKNLGSHAYIVFNQAYDKYLKLLDESKNNSIEYIFENIDECYASNLRLFCKYDINNGFLNMNYNNIKDEFPQPSIYNKQNTNNSVCCSGRLGNMLFEIAGNYNNINCYNNINVNSNQNEYEYYNKISKQLNDVFENVHFNAQKLDNLYFYGYKQSENYFNTKNIKYLYKIKDNVINELRTKYRCIDFNKSVGIHVRRGDYVYDNQYHNIPISWYIKIYEKYFKNDEYTIIVISDDIEYCKQNIKIKNTLFVHDTEINDLLVFSLCKHHICSSSTYSWWGCWLNEQKDSINIFNKFWFNPASQDIIQPFEKEIEKNIIPTRWIRED